MHEGAGGVKRGQTEPEKNSHHDKWRKREWIKRGLRDIPCVQYEEYEASCDQEIQAKKCKGSINCMLDRCGCMERLTENLAGTVRISPPSPGIRDQQAGMIPALSVQPGRASTATLQSNLVPPTTSQSTRNQGRQNRSWSGSLYPMGLMLLFMSLSVMVTGVKDWSESPHNCRLHPRMLSYRMPGKELFSFNQMEWNSRNQGVRSIRECYFPKIRDTSHVEVQYNSALAREDGLQQQADVKGPRVGYVLQDQHSIIGYNAVLQLVDIIRAVPRARCVQLGQHVIVDYGGVPQCVVLAQDAVIDPG